jgi:hypothetical protein
MAVLETQYIAYIMRLSFHIVWNFIAQVGSNTYYVYNAGRYRALYYFDRQV